jgi:hypothetical protein
MTVRLSRTVCNHDHYGRHSPSSFVEATAVKKPDATSKCRDERCQESASGRRTDRHRRTSKSWTSKPLPGQPAAGRGRGCGFCLPLLLPDAAGCPALKTSNPRTTAFIELRAREARRGRDPRRIQQWVSYKEHLAKPHARVLVAERPVLAARRRGRRTTGGITEADWARGASFAAAAPSLSSSRKPLSVAVEESVEEAQGAHHRAAIEAELEKSRILELYLNVIEWGDGILRRGSRGTHIFPNGAGSLGLRRQPFSRAPSSIPACSTRRIPPRGSCDVKRSSCGAWARRRRRRTWCLRHPPCDIVTQPPGDETPAETPPPDDTPQPVLPEDPVTDPNAVPQ